ncbi:PstS family phosphate ABC transporter substrate-binding protein [Laspinema olomoucense]|uniref:PstS family phosphate ABC transporter substrate-binding protein n=1 Tax=Laspinema olomoucense TaxID=3231600 RepID=UPI0021BAE54B|nr:MULTISPECIES: PstS family phosphate ABC transporter substrate-binding protein [unclassified Laspinema]MCT7990468.1 PstS family phosphate ABC transporter substrate-binding protein [Laspinema sp. D3a]MCT7993115.1 PstS family phosphate ABC transporter substrate-binding protein [Laspinema sp. D3c]
MRHQFSGKYPAKWAALTLLILLGLTACRKTETSAQNRGGRGDINNLSVDGSSTVFPISEAMAEEFMKINPGVKVTIGISGSGGGFEKFCQGEIDISNASRAIDVTERELCEENGIEYIEIPIALDGISVVVHPNNDFVQCLSVEELKRIWEPAAEGKIVNWNQIRSTFPNRPLRLFGPGTDSGTHDYFTAALVGQEQQSRGDYTASEDDNIIVQGVAADAEGLGFFGYSYYQENKNKLKLVEIDSGEGCIAPTPSTIADNSYQPLSRPEFIYINKSQADRPDVKAFVEFHLNPEYQYLISEVGYVPLPESVIKVVRNRYQQRKVGSVFKSGSTVEINLHDALKVEN